MNTQKITESINLDEFTKLIEKYKNNIFVSLHAAEHLSLAQRNLYSENDLKNPLLKEKPIFVGIQKNSRYVVFYKRDKYYLKIIIAVYESRRRIEIITFINSLYLPQLNKK